MLQHACGKGGGERNRGPQLSAKLTSDSRSSVYMLVHEHRIRSHFRVSCVGTLGSNEA